MRIRRHRALELCPRRPVILFRQNRINMRRPLIVPFRLVIIVEPHPPGREVPDVSRRLHITGLHRRFRGTRLALGGGHRDRDCADVVVRHVQATLEKG